MLSVQFIILLWICIIYYLELSIPGLRNCLLRDNRYMGMKYLLEIPVHSGHGFWKHEDSSPPAGPILLVNCLRLEHVWLEEYTTFTQFLLFHLSTGFPTADQYMNGFRISVIFTIKYYTTTPKNLLRTIWVNLGNIILNEIRQCT